MDDTDIAIAGKLTSASDGPVGVTAIVSKNSTMVTLPLGLPPTGVSGSLISSTR